MRVMLALAGCLLPGLAWWVWLGDRRQDALEAIARVVGVSVGAVSLLTLVLYLVRVPATPFLLGASLAIAAFLILVGIFRKPEGAFTWSWLFALLILGALALWRFWQARGLLLPNWVDSPHHVLIVRKMLEAGGLTADLQPYLPGPFYYHYAFHSFTALFAALGGLEPAQSVLWMGNFLNAAASLSVYALAKALTKDRKAAFIALLFSAFLMKMPGFYLSWGRYSLLAGVLLLPLAMAEGQRAFEEGWVSWKRSAALFLLTGGTLLAHYFTAYLLAIFLVLLALLWLGASLKAKHWEWYKLLAAAGPVLLALICVTPWYARVLSHAATISPMTVATTLAAPTAAQWRYLGELLGPQIAMLLLGIAAVAALWALTQPGLRALGLWALLAGLFTIPSGFQVFGFRSDHYALILFLPVSVLAAALLAWLSENLGRLTRHPQPAELALTSLVILLVMAGGIANQRPVNPDTTFVDRKDLTALQWVREHTPPDARFFVNTTLWSFETYRGVDGGAWLLPYTGRWSLAPTIFYSFGAPLKTSLYWKAWGETASTLTSCDADFWALVEDANLNYIYARDDRGSLRATAFEGCPGLRQLYRSGGVGIWRVDSLPDPAAEDVEQP